MAAGFTSKSRRPEANTGAGNTALTGKKSGWPSEFGQKSVCGKPETNATSAAGEDPGEKKEKGAKFEAIAEAWRKNMGNVWSASHATTVKGRLKLDVYPYIGERPIANISPQDMLTVLRRIENRKAYETASRV
ncbi:MAG: hypothetical protein Q4B25_11015, partial [Pseudomonadota bacterium]|nr:hypothetical protein [Pseudomonadota bacterium]